VTRATGGAFSYRTNWKLNAAAGRLRGPST